MARRWDCHAVALSAASWIVSLVAVPAAIVRPGRPGLYIAAGLVLSVALLMTLFAIADAFDRSD